MRRRSISFALISLLLLASAALAQTSSTYDLEWSVLGSAGLQFAEGSGYQLGFTLAQDTPPLVGASSSYQMIQGYWVGEGGPPTAVTLTGFWVEAQEGALLARWETASEVDLLGFHLYRQATADGEFIRLNAALMPSQVPGSPLGAVYTWLDKDVEHGVVYDYKLEAVDVHGHSTEHGPVQAFLPEIHYRIYLPRIQQGP